MQQEKMYKIRGSFMAEWETYDSDIEETERLLLPKRAQFSEDAREVIRCWHSTDVEACPGSGKTTVLLAKLKLLADRMPFGDGAGICVLSHTNVAVNEIKTRLSNYADKLLSYPNYIGTIQSFVDKFVTLPYLRNVTGKNVQAVDGFTYAQCMFDKMNNDENYSTLKYVVKNSFEQKKRFTKLNEYIQELYLQKDGTLCLRKYKTVLAGADKLSAKQYKILKEDLLKNEGIMTYRDAYFYATDAVKEFSATYTNLFSLRFKYVFIDEYQDCSDVQRKIIDSIFNSENCSVMKIGDSDQAIYNFSESEVPDWVPNDGFLPITTSCRYSQEIADVICKLRKGKDDIVTLTGNTGVKPVLLIFNPENIDKVIYKFIDILKTHGFSCRKGIYKAIGAVGKNVSGLKIGSYWSGFDRSVKKKDEYNYWILVDNIIRSLLEGKLYKTEHIILKLLCRIFHYAKVKNPISDRDFSVRTIKKFLDEEYHDMYRQWYLELSMLQNLERKTIDCFIRQKINELFTTMNFQTVDIFDCLPKDFLVEDEDIDISKTENFERNFFIDSSSGIKVKFDTIHGVKGETHDATLYLETDFKGASDLNRILPYYGVGKMENSKLYDYSRKLAYVGMSRPKKLLCVAMQAKTYEKSKGAFDRDWEIIELK